MQKVNHPLKARMYVGGLKSVLVDIVNDIEEIEKTGGVPSKFIESLIDIKAAIDLTLAEFKKVTVRCCEHGTEHDVCDDSCSDDVDHCDECGEFEDECACEEGHVEDDVDRCDECGEFEDECICEEEDAPPPPVRKLNPIKKSEAKVVAPVRKKGR